jgi:hypothetical protein
LFLFYYDTEVLADAQSMPQVSHALFLHPRRLKTLCEHVGINISPIVPYNGPEFLINTNCYKQFTAFPNRLENLGHYGQASRKVGSLIRLCWFPPAKLSQTRLNVKKPLYGKSHNPLSESHLTYRSTIPIFQPVFATDRSDEQNLTERNPTDGNRPSQPDSALHQEPHLPGIYLLT